MGEKINYRLFAASHRNMFIGDHTGWVKGINIEKKIIKFRIKRIYSILNVCIADESRLSVDEKKSNEKVCSATAENEEKKEKKKNKDEKESKSETFLNVKEEIVYIYNAL